MKRRLFSMLALMLLFTVAGYAQRGGGAGQGGQRPDPKEQAKATADTWQEKFGLSDDQHKKVYDVLLASTEKRTAKMQEMREAGGMDREAMTAAMTKLQEDQDAELKKIFSETQWTAYEQWKKDNPPMQRRRGGGK